MPKSKYLLRFALLTRLVKSRPGISFQEIQRDVVKNLQILNERDGKTPTGYSKRSFERDMKDIREAAGIEISYDPTVKGYILNSRDYGSFGIERNIDVLFEYQVFNANRETKQYLQLEPQPIAGSEHLLLILHGLKSNCRLRFNYQKFYESLPTQRNVEPLVLKQFKRRWYLLARDCGDGQKKTFGLDRISDLNNTTEKFTYPSDFEPIAYYKHCFGIINPDEDDVPYDVELTVFGLQGKYIKTMPLHPSQQLISETADSISIRLHLYITEDFIIEVLSHGPKVKVIKPEWFANQVMNRHKEAYSQYKEG